MLRSFILLLYAYVTVSIGFDSGGGDRTTCGRPYRSGRIYQPSCDLGRLGYCTQAGQLYPWKAVKRFVRDNQGLMRRMYGDQRHGHVLRSELDDDDNVLDDEDIYQTKELYSDWRPHHLRFSKYRDLEDIDNNVDVHTDKRTKNPYVEESRYLKDDLLNEDVLNTKFVVSKQDAAIAIKLAELKAAAHFKLTNQRPSFLSHKNTYIKTTTTTSTATPSTSRPTTQQIPTSSSSSYKSTTKNSYSNNEVSASKSHDDKVVNDEPITIDNDWGNTEATSEMNFRNNIMSSTTTTSTTINSNFDPSASVETSEPLSTDTTTDLTTENKLVIATENGISEEASNNSATTAVHSSLSTNYNNNNNDNVASDRISQHIDNDNNQISESVNSNGVNQQKIEDKIDVNVDNNNDNNNENNKYKDSDDTSHKLYQDQEANKKNFIVDYNKMKGVNACPVKEEVVAPFWANNTRGEVLALLNMYPFEQYVHWEKCTYEHRQMYCRDGCRCEQQYRLHRLLAYDPNNECRGIFSDWFRFPSCCICKCYDIPAEFRVTSRSPRFHFSYNSKNNEGAGDVDEENSHL